MSQSDYAAWQRLRQEKDLEQIVDSWMRCHGGLELRMIAMEERVRSKHCLLPACNRSNELAVSDKCDIADSRKADSSSRYRCRLRRALNQSMVNWPCVSDQCSTSYVQI